MAACKVTTDVERVMDSNALERERGITIFSKYTSLAWRGHRLNVMDTPGHSDFGGEVERVLSMVDGALLLVDAVEGPLAQTKFVLAKALARGLAPVVVLNKVDRPAATPARCGAVAGQVFDLFAALGASDAQLDFPLLYASAREGWAADAPPARGDAAAAAAAKAAGMAPLLDAILRHVPAPAADPSAPFALCVAMIERDPYVGRLATGRVAAGRARVGDRVRVLQHPAGGSRGGGLSAAAPAAAAAAAEEVGAAAPAAGAGAAAGAAAAEAPPPAAVVDDLRITRIVRRAGLETVALQEAAAGDIVQIAGAGDAAGIADTIASPAVERGIDPGPIDPPTLSMVFSANDSPLAGRSGKAVTARAIGERLMAEAEGSVSLRVTPVKVRPAGWRLVSWCACKIGLLHPLLSPASDLSHFASLLFLCLSASKQTNHTPQKTKGRRRRALRGARARRAAARRADRVAAARGPRVQRVAAGGRDARRRRDGAAPRARRGGRAGGARGGLKGS